MPEHAPAERIADLERAILRGLCTRSIDASLWQEIRVQLAGYVWSEPDHSVVYEAILRVNSRNARNPLAHLVAQATRMGFPDLGWEVYLSPSAAPEANIGELVRKLKATARQA